MRPILIIFLFIFLGCKQKSYDEFDFSFGNTFETDFSIKFLNNDTVYIRENWSANDINDNSKAPKSKTNYYSILNKQQIKKLDSFINNTDFTKFDTLYHENYADGEYYKFYIKKNNFIKTIKVHSHNVPKGLEKFAYWIYETKKGLKLEKTKKILDFKSKEIYPEPPKLN